MVASTAAYEATTAYDNFLEIPTSLADQNLDDFKYSTELRGAGHSGGHSSGGGGSSGGHSSGGYGGYGGNKGSAYHNGYTSRANGGNDYYNYNSSANGNSGSPWGGIIAGAVVVGCLGWWMQVPNAS